jgi:hypothetical protein
LASTIRFPADIPVGVSTISTGYFFEGFAPLKPPEDGPKSRTRFHG